jgi:hypothetical protein
MLFLQGGYFVNVHVIVKLMLCLVKVNNNNVSLVLFFIQEKWPMYVVKGAYFCMYCRSPPSWIPLLSECGKNCGLCCPPQLVSMLDYILLSTTRLLWTKFSFLRTKFLVLVILFFFYLWFSQWHCWWVQSSGLLGLLMFQRMIVLSLSGSSVLTYSRFLVRLYWYFYNTEVCCTRNTWM